MKLSYQIKQNECYANLRELLKLQFYISDRLLLKLKKNKKLFLNGKNVFLDSPVFSGDLIEIFIDFVEDSSNIIPTKMNLDIIYEDEAYIVINKPAGIPVHPSLEHYEDSISNGLKYYFDTINLHKKIRPVNRLDKNTSGIVIFAKNEYIQECLVKQMKQDSFKKEYIAICEGIFDKKSGTINAPIARKENSIIERCINENGSPSITHYEVLGEISNISPTCTIVKCILETGRTHQIRVHLNHIGHPILGDTLYGNTTSLINRQALHSYITSFIHPITKTHVKYIAKLPDDILTLLPDFHL